MIDNSDIKFIKENLNFTNKEIANKLNLTEKQVEYYIRKFKFSRRIKLVIQDSNEVFISLKEFGFSNYRISNFGRIVNSEDIIIQPSKTPDGYLSTKIVSDSGKRTTIRLNRLVAKAFLPNDDLTKIEVNHKNGDKLDNTVDNLEWVTPSENQKHAYKNNLRKPIYGINSHLTKHTEEEVINVCIMIKENYPVKEILEKYPNLKSGWIHEIKNKKIWKRISDKFFN